MAHQHDQNNNNKTVSNTFINNDISTDIKNIMHDAYLQYSLSVNIGRAIPDVRDGLKYSSRRILYAMHMLGLKKAHKYTKSAKVVGEVIGNYHPHGDQSIYEALVRMAQDFSMRYPLIDGQGNFGSIDGDPPAAYRYTECKMEKLTEELLQDIDKKTVNMIPTFDGSNLEPEIFPAKIPNLLMNGSTGIGVGMATNIPPHNLREIINAILMLIKNPNVSILNIIQHAIQGPDLPTYGIIKGQKGIIDLYHTGRGNIKIRSKIEIIDKDNKQTIIIKELPYTVNKENLIKNIANLVKDKKIEGISALRDETSKRIGIKIVIELKKNSPLNIILNQLYIKTQLEINISCIFLVVDNGQPKILNLKQILHKYLDHRLKIITNKTKYELNKAENRIEILNGLLIAVKQINIIIKIIKTSNNKQKAHENLINYFLISKIQANAILEMKLHQLTNLSVNELQTEYNKLINNISDFKSLLNDKKLILKIIENELIDIKNRYTKENDRRTNIDNEANKEINIIDLISDYNCTIILSNKNYIQKIKTTAFKIQHRGGRGARGMHTQDFDFTKQIIVTNNYDMILFFTDNGNMYHINAYEIPESNNKTNKGRAIINLINYVKPNDHICLMLPINRSLLINKNLYLIFATKNGIIKKTSLYKYMNFRKSALKAINIDNNDNLIDIALTDGNYEILLSSSMGKTCRFNEQNIKATGRGTRGVRGMKFKINNDYINNMLVLKNNNIDKKEQCILTITNNGIGKKSFIKNYRITQRGAKGVINIALTSKQKVISTLLVQNSDEFIVITKRGQIIRIPIIEIRTVGRISKGVKIASLNNDLIINAAKITNAIN